MKGKEKDIEYSFFVVVITHFINNNLDYKTSYFFFDV